MAHGLHLLELVGRENAGKLLLGTLVDGAHLLVQVVRGERRVGAQCRQLLIAVGEDGFQFGGLVGGKVQHLAEMFGLMLRAGLSVMPLLRRGLLAVGRGLLGEGGSAREGERECCREDGAIHRVAPWAALGRDSLRLME